MHEMGITHSIVEIAERHARAHQARRITSIRVEIGALSGVIAEAVEFCFEAVSRGTLAAGARLCIETVAGLGCCRACGAQSAVERFELACPVCAALALEIIRGEELRVIELEVD